MALAAAVLAGVGGPAWAAPPKKEQPSPQQHETPSPRPAPGVNVKQPKPPEALEPGRLRSLSPAAERTLRETASSPQAAIQSVDRPGGGGPVSVGDTVRLRVGIRNPGSVPAEVAVAAFTNGFTSALRSSRSVTILPGAVNYNLWVDVGIDPSMMRGDEFRTTVFLARPDAPLSGSPLTMGWRDNNDSDNTAEVSFPVEVPVYVVRVTLESIDVHNDCDSGRDNPGEWTFNFGAEARDSIPYDNNLASPRESRRMSVNSGSSYPIGISFDFPSVGANQYIWLQSWAAERDIAAGDGPGHIHLLLNPEDWQRRGVFTETSVEAGDRCQGGFTAHFRMSSRAETIR